MERRNGGRGGCRGMKVGDGVNALSHSQMRISSHKFSACSWPGLCLHALIHGRDQTFPCLRLSVSVLLLIHKQFMTFWRQQGKIQPEPDSDEFDGSYSGQVWWPESRKNKWTNAPLNAAKVLIRPLQRRFLRWCSTEVSRTVRRPVRVCSRRSRRRDVTLEFVFQAWRESLRRSRPLSLSCRALRPSGWRRSLKVHSFQEFLLIGELLPACCRWVGGGVKADIFDSVFADFLRKMSFSGC